MSKNKKSKSKQKRQEPVIESLEPRIMMSADLPGLDTLDISPDDPLDVDIDRILAQAEEAFLTAQNELDSGAAEWTDEVAAVVPADEPEVLLPSSELPDDVRRELIIVDPSVPDYELLLAGVNAVGGEDTRLNVVVLDPYRSGIEQISEILASRSGLGAIHLISHGDDAAIRIGGDTLDLALIQQDPDTFSEWGGALSEEGDILIYGCNVAETETGQVLIDTLAEMTRADVAASDDLTGHESLGGDWDLEYTAGDIEAEVAVSEPAQAKWTATLNQGTAIWAESGSSFPEYNTWDGTSFGAEGTAYPTGQWRIMQGAESPERDEKIVIGVDASGNIEGMLWDGSSWSQISVGGSNIFGTVSQSYWWGMDVQYESQSGDAVMAWNDGNNIEYATWDGSSWSAVSTISGFGGATPRQLQLAASPDSDEMVLIVSDSNSHDFAFVWDGSSWGNAITLSSTSGDDRSDIFIAYEQQSGDAMVVYGKADVDAYYRTWDGSSWSSEGSVSQAIGASGNVRWTTMASDPNSDEIGLGVLTSGGDVWFNVWDGSSWDTSTVATTSSTGTTELALAVAFESNSGDLIATYGESGSSTVKYMTWSAGSGWSAEQNGPSIGGVPNSMTLSSDPQSDKVMLAVNDDNSDVNYVLWDGTAWGTVTEHETNSGETKNQPFLFLWDQVENAAPVNTIPGTQNTAIDTPLVFNTTNGNLISVADSDDPSVEVTLTATNGVLTLNPGATGSLASIAGDGTDTVTFSGSLADVNAALDGLQFDPTAAFEGYATVQIATTDTGAGGAGGIKSDTDILTIEVGDVNTAPVNSVPAAQTIDQDGMLLFSSATGSAITISDSDAGGAAVEVTLTASNGVLNLQTTQGLTFTPPADGAADATMTFTGTVADINAALEGMTFVATPGFAGTAGVQIVTNDMGNSGAGGAQSDTDSVVINVRAADQKLWLTFENDEGGTGSSEIPSMTGGDVVTFGDITQLETSNSNPVASTTAGTLAYGFNLDTVLLSGGGAASDGNTIVNAVHRVGSDIQIGTNNVQLYAGDLLLSTAAAEDIGGVTYEKEDVFVFRPDTAGDYSQGSFFRLIDGKNDTGWGDVSGITLVEQTTVVGGVTLNAGEILVAHDGSGKNILRFTPGTLGDTTTGTTTILVAGTDVGIDQKVGGLHLVQADTVIGGKSLTAGELLVSLQGNDNTVGDGTTIDVLRQDIFVLNVTGTGVGSSAATAERFFEGLDEGLDNNNESIWGIGYQGNSPPVIANAGFTLDENSTNGSVVGSVTANDPELGALSYAITAGNTDGAFAIDANTGQITVANSAALDYETTPGFMLTVAAIDAEGAYGTSTVEIKLNDLVENSAPTLSLANVVTSLSEATDTSSAVKIADIVVSDDGVGTNDLTLVGADAASFEIVGSELRLKAGAALDFETNPNPDVTVQVDDSSVGGTPDDSVVLGLSITDANDAPLLDDSGDMALTSIFENQANSTGTLVSDIIASAGGDRITDQDGDPEGIAITAVDNSNGTWQYSTDGGSNWFDVGAVSDGSALLLSATATDLVRFVPDTAFNGTAGISFRAWDTTDGSSSGDSGIDVTGNGGNTAFSAATESANITVAPIDIKLYLSTAGDVSGAGTAGADSWARGDIVAIGDPGFAFEADGAKDASAETSGGTFYNATLDFLNTSNTANSDGIGNVQISGMHYVGQDVMVGSTTTIDLLAGDLLLAVSHNSATFQGSDLSSVNVGREDVFVFRPDTAGDYSSGSYFLLFADVPGGGERLTGITLAEQSTVVGEGGGKRTLDAGTLLYSRGGFLQQNNIYIFEPDEVGTTTTGNRGELLVSGDDIGMGATGGSGVAITGLSLIEDNVTVDGVTLNAGNILVTLDGADAAVGNIGATAAGGMGDVYTLAVSNAGAGTTAEATLLYDASDLGLDNSAERIDAFAVLIDTTGGKQDPGLNLGGGTLAFTEDDGPTVIAPGANISDGDSVNFSGGALRVEFTVNGTLNDRLSIENQGAGASQVGLVGDLVQYEGTTVGSLSGGTGGVPLVISFNSSATDTIVEAIARAVTFDNISGDPSELTRTVQFQVTDGDGGTSALKTKDITVTAVDDNPTITSAAGASVVENSTAVMTVTATDPELDTPSFYITGGADAAFFAIDSATGALSFRDAPDFEGAADADGNNSYLVEVSARDGNGNTDSLLVTVSVTDVNETPLASDWYDADWGQRKAVTIDASQVAGSLRDFPVLVSIAADTDLAARALANGDDILFTGADGTTKLAHEIESFDSATGELRVWVKTDLSAGQDTVLYLYYGNATATSQQDPGNVWDGDFVGVWHLDEAPDGNAGVNEILDSTVNAQHGNTEGAIDATDLVTAKIGEGIDFDSVDASLIRVTDSATLDSTAGGGTFELWVNFDNTADGNHQILMSSSNRYTSGANDGFEWASQGDGDHFFYPWGGDNSNYNLGPDPFTNGQWHHLAVSFDFDQQDANIYVDGVEMAYTNEWVSTYWDTLANPADWLWGGNPDRGTRYFDGMMDEIRVSNTDRSLAWIQTSYANQWDAASFASVGAEESRALSVTEDAANDTSLGFVSGFDDDADALTYAITGGNVGNAFKINAATGEIQVNDASAIDYETLNSYTLSISVTDPEGEVDTASVAIAVTDVNEAPSVSLVNPTNTIAENTDTSSAIKVADIVINDDALGTNTLSLTGADAGSFEIAGSELRLKAGTVLDFETQASYDVSVQVDDSGVGGAPDDTAMHPFAVTNVNEAPAFNNSGGSQTFVENGSAIVLDPDHTITDPELTALDNFAGATLTLARSGGASSDDEFSASGTLSALIEGGNLDVGITTIGTVTTNSGGTLVLTFNANATNALVNQAMQQVAYSNGSDTPPASVQIDWTFDDGNSGGQGSGGALKAIGGTTVTITPVNDAPTVESTIADQNLNEDFASYTIDLNAAFADVETADGALVYGVSGNTNINVSIASGIATITPTADWNGSESLTFTATDAGGLSVSQVVGFAVTAVADIADDSAVAVTEDTATIITVLGNDSFEGTPVVTATSSPANGAVVINGDNTITYTPNSNYTGADSFTYTVTSGGVTETATVSLNVTPVNDAPTVESTIADQNLNEDFASYTIDLNAAFADVETADGALVYGVSGNTNINVSIASGIATITPTADWNGSESLTFTATDAGGLSVSQVVGFAVTAVADIADDSAVAVTEDTATIITVLGNDSFEGTPVVTATSSPANGAVVINGDNTITYTPNSNYTGADSFTYTVTSGGVTETATVSLNVTPVNDAPTVESTIADQNLNEDFASYTIDLNAAFADVETADGALVYGVSGNTNINVSIASGIATITPTADWNGSESLTFTATDAGGLSVSQVVGFAVTAVADIADDSAVAVTEDTATIITVLGNDSFEGTPVVTATSSPANGAVVINGDNTITYTPNSNYTGADSFTYTVTSGGVTETATVSLNVTPVNDAPTVESTIADQNLNEDFASYTIDLNAAFADVETADGALVYGVSGNTNINVSIASGIATITPTADWNGSESLTFTATDAGGLSVSQVVGFAVTAVADIADDSAVAVTEDTATIITVLGNDSFEGTPVVTATSSPANGAVVINGDNTITYTPNSNYTGADSFTYTVTSGGVTETATVSLNVTPVNDAPTVESTIADQNLNEDFASYTIDLNAAFADVETADGALVYGVSGNTNINVSIASGIATITPTADWNGSESLTFTATDAGGLSVSQVVGFAVTAVADIADDSAVAVTEDTATIITVLGNDSFEGTPVVTATSSPANGAVVINGDNTITYTPNSNYTGADSFTYTVTSGGVTETATVSLNVTPVNDAPTVESTIADQNLNEDFASYTIDLNAAFADVETADGALVYGVSGNTNINVSIASGIATITPTADWNGSESLTFTATDAGGLSVSQVVGFAVTAVADIADDSAVAVTEDTATIITVLGNDSFEGTPVVTATSSPANGAVVINGDNTITYTPNSNYTGADSFTYTVTSGGVTETATVSLNVTPVNDAPTVESTIADQNLNEDFASYTIDLNAAFADVETADGALVYGVSGNTNINVSIASGIATITPTADWNGSESLTFTATDAGGLSVSQVVGFAVTAVADIADDSAVAVTEDTATIITVLGNDSFEGTPVVTATSSPANGAVVINGDNTITYTPNSNYTGADSFTYTVTSGGVTETATVSLNVTPVNDAPTIGGIDVGAVAEDTAPDLDTLLETAGALTITDPDAGESSFVAGTVAGTHGHLIIDASGNWDYEVDNTQASIQQLDAGESINDVLTVTTADGTTHDITVTINGAEDDPVIAGSTSALVTEDGTLTVTGSLTITDADASDSPVSFPDEASTPGDNGYGDFQLTAGNWSYALNNAHATVQALAAGASLTDTHTFTASDGSTQVVSIVIAGAAEAVPPPVVEPPVPEPEPIERAAQPPETEDPVEPPAEADPAPESEPLTGATDPSASEPESEGLAASASSSRLPEPLEPDEIFLEILTDARPNDVQTVKQPAVVAKPTAETAQTFLQELKSFWKEDSTTASIEMSEVHLSKEFWNGLDKMAQDLDESIEKEDKHHRLSAEAAAGVSISLTAGFVSWAMRAGSMAASMLAALPTWRHFDPMPVLSADEKKKQAPASTEEADEETREMEKNERIERLFGGD